MRNERMYAELVELLKTDSASGRESAVAELLKKKLAELGLAVFQDNAGETFGGECGNVIGVWEGSLDGALMLSAHMDRVPNGLGVQPVERDGVHLYGMRVRTFARQRLFRRDHPQGG